MNSSVMEISMVREAWLELRSNVMIVHFNRSWAKEYEVNDQV